MGQIILNIPALSILIPMITAIFSSVLKGKTARRVCLSILVIEEIMTMLITYFTYVTGESYWYTMGFFQAPWGNEIRFGMLECGMALFTVSILFLSLLGGRNHCRRDIEPDRQHLYYVMINLLLASLLALIYTNDLFTAYVFVEINTIAACGLIMITQKGRTIEAAMRYMIMSLLGSGLFLMGISILYELTGHLLMDYIQEAVALIVANGMYHIPLQITIVFMLTGLAIKSALFPFHAWLPDAYGYSTVSSSAILSGLVSKGYIFLTIKIIYRVIGIQVIYESGILNILFLFGISGMIFGSLSAMKENDIKRMIAYSSVAQIGYIYMGFGLGSTAGIVAAVFHIFSHGATKSLLFSAAEGMVDASGRNKAFIHLTGVGYRNKIATLAFSVGALSMVGIPFFSGFISKLLFAQAAVGSTAKLLPTLIALAVSTFLNTIYFMKTVIRIYTPVEHSGFENIPFSKDKTYGFAMILFMILNVFLGMMSQPIVELIEKGLVLFA